MSIAIARADSTRPRAASTWLLWIAASAAIPALTLLRDVLVQRQFGLHFQAQHSVIFISLILLTIAPALIQGMVLRRLVPQMSLLLWLGASWISAIVAFFLLEGLRQAGFNGEFAFGMAVLRHPGSSLPWAWVQLALHAAAVAVLYSIAPLLTFGWMAKRPVRWFFVANVAGACAAILLFKLYTGFNHLDVRSLHAPVDMTHAQFAWRDIAQWAVTVAAFGMVQGAIGGYGLMRMFASPARPLGTATMQVFAAVAIVLVAMHGIRYVMSPLGYSAGFPDIRRVFSAAPTGDRSAGQPILSLAHRIELPGPAWYAVPSADGRMVLAWMKDQTLRRIDVERRSVAEAPLLAGGGARAIVFSPDGRYVAVSQRGELRGARESQLGRIRLFATDGFAEIKDLMASEQNCPFSSTMTFSADSRLLWIACERSRSNPGDLLAVALRIPDLDVVERNAGPDELAGKVFAIPSDIMANADGAFVALFQWPGDSNHVIVVNLRSGKPVFASRNVLAADMGGAGFGFCGLHLSQDAALVTLAHCGLADAMRKRDAYRTTGQFRTFDTRSGNLIADFARQSGDGNVTSWTAAFDRVSGRVAAIGTMLASRSGTLVIFDQRTGQELQRITTAAYRTVRFSHDGRWLAVLGRDENAVSLYRAAP